MGISHKIKKSHFWLFHKDISNFTKKQIRLSLQKGDSRSSTRNPVQIRCPKGSLIQRLPGIKTDTDWLDKTGSGGTPAAFWSLFRRGKSDPGFGAGEALIASPGFGAGEAPIVTRAGARNTPKAVFWASKNGAAGGKTTKRKRQTEKKERKKEVEGCLTPGLLFSAATGGRNTASAGGRSPPYVPGRRRPLPRSAAPGPG